MGFLLISICASVLVSVLLKVARPRGINLAVAIMINYVVCSLLTLVFLKPVMSSEILTEGWLIFAALGVLLPSVFLIMGQAVRHAGIVKSDTAQRLALIIPILASFLIFKENLTATKATALVLVFVAMGCLLYKKQTNTSLDSKHAPMWLLGVFFGYGVIDVLLKQLSKLGSATAGNLIVSFSLALIFMIAYLVIKRIRLDKTSIIGGLVLGLLNFCNIYTYIQAHKAMSDTPTLVFAGMNMGVIVLGTLTGLIIFKEKISPLNAVGIVLALVAIARLWLI